MMTGRALDPSGSRGLRPGTVISARYEPGRLLASGGMVLVYEQLEDPASLGLRSDVWSLGVVLFEMLTGACPFYRWSLAEPASSMLSGATPEVRSLRPELDRRLAAVVESCLERDRDCRFDACNTAPNIFPELVYD